MRSTWRRAVLAGILGLAAVMAGCGSPGYGAVSEDDQTVNQDLGMPVPHGTMVFGVGNSGRPIQDLIVTAGTGGTVQILGVRSYIQLDSKVTRIDLSKGGVYMPPHWMTAEPRGNGTWDLGDLPHGYRAVIWLRLRHLHRKGGSYHLNVNWYAVSSFDQPRTSWHRLTGLAAAWG